MTSKFFKCQLFYLSFSLVPTILAAQNLGNKPVDLEVTNLPVSEVLEAIAREGQFYFSYNSRLVPKDSLVTADFSRTTVNAALIKLFGTKYRYVEKSCHLIILPARQELVEIEGSVRDYGSGEAIASAFLYAATGHFLTTSDANGNFRIAVAEDKFPFNLSIRKMSYRDTTLLINKFAYHQQLLLASSPTILEPLVIRGQKEPITAGRKPTMRINHWYRGWLRGLWKRKRCPNHRSVDR